VYKRQLLHRADGTGLVPAMEIMIVTPGVRNLIRERKTHQLYTLIQGGAEMGMQTFDQHLLSLYAQGTIKAEEALAKASNPEEFARQANIGGDREEAA